MLLCLNVNVLYSCTGHSILLITIRSEASPSVSEKGDSEQNTQRKKAAYIKVPNINKLNFQKRVPSLS